MSSTFLFPKFIQGDLYLENRWAYIQEAYIRDVDWVSYLGAYIWLRLINGILQCIIPRLLLI